MNCVPTTTAIIQRPVAWLTATISLICSLSFFNAMAQAERAETLTLRVEDHWVQEQRDPLTKVLVDKVIRTVRTVSPIRIEGSYEPEGLFLWTTELNLIQTKSTTYEGDPKFLSFPLEVGKK